MPGGVHFCPFYLLIPGKSHCLMEEALKGYLFCWSPSPLNSEPGPPIHQLYCFLLSVASFPLLLVGGWWGPGGIPSCLLKPPLYNEACQSLLSKTEGKQTNHKKSPCLHNDNSTQYYVSWDEKVFFKLAKPDGKRMRIFKLRSGLSLEVRLCW